ncbi:MAG: hypothetical protein AAF799_42045 [Myxococcota bacterium]
MSRDDLRAEYWDAYEDGLAPPPGSAARNLARIRERIAAGEAVEPSRPRPERRRAVAGAGAGVLLWGKAAAVTVGISIAAVVSLKLAVVAWTGTTTSEPNEGPAEGQPAVTAPAQPRAKPSPRAPAQEPSPIAPAPAETSPRPAEPTTTITPRPGPARTAKNASTLDTLRAEVTLMERARAALTRGDTTALSKLLRQHADRFPTGALTEEREAWRAVVACRTQAADASSRASRFLREHPDSPQAARVRSECVPVRKVR